jgi:predicted amidohydrolase YtcJ
MLDRTNVRVLNNKFRREDVMVRKLTALVIVWAGMCAVASAVAQQGDFNAPDIVLINGKVLTLDDRSTVTEAVAVRDGKILATGTSASIKLLAGDRTRVLDLSGKTVIPGLIDTHAHFKTAGLADYVVNMSQTKTVAEALDAIKVFAAKKKPGEWIVGGAWHPPSQLAEKRYLTRQEIDSVAPDNPVYLRTVGHFSMANTMALQKAGIDKTTANPSGGSFERDAAGEMTGVLVETAINQVEKAVPPWTEDDGMRQFTIAESVLNSFGITSAVEGATEARDIRTLQKIAASGQSDLACRRDVPARAAC